MSFDSERGPTQSKQQQQRTCAVLIQLITDPTAVTWQTLCAVYCVTLDLVVEGSWHQGWTLSLCFSLPSQSQVCSSPLRTMNSDPHICFWVLQRFYMFNLLLERSWEYMYILYMWQNWHKSWLYLNFIKPWLAYTIVICCCSKLHEILVIV